MMMTRRVRRFALTAHLVVSIGWVGAVAAYLALDVTVATSETAETLRAAYIAMDLIVARVIVPLAFASLVTGLVMALGTKWGLFRHYWVLISLILTIVAILVLLSEARIVGSWAARASAPETSSDDLRALGSSLVHSIGGLVVLLAITGLNVYKPTGMTRYGWRRRQRERTASKP